MSQFFTFLMCPVVYHPTLLLPNTVRMTSPDSVFPPARRYRSDGHVPPGRIGPVILHTLLLFIRIPLVFRSIRQLLPSHSLPLLPRHTYYYYLNAFRTRRWIFSMRLLRRWNLNMRSMIENFMAKGGGLCGTRGRLDCNDMHAGGRGEDLRRADRGRVE